MPDWIDVRDKMPEADEFVLVVVNGKHKNIAFVNAIEIAAHDDEGWYIEAYPDFENPQISHWMPLPEPPIEAKMDERSTVYEKGNA